MDLFKKSKKEKNRKREIIEWVICIVIALIIALIFKYYIGIPTMVQMTSMYPTLEPEDRLILNRTIRIFNRIPERGEIITFEAPSKKTYSSSEVDQKNPKAKYENEPDNIISAFMYNVIEQDKESYIKRVIGLPNEHVEIKNGKVYIEGKILDEPYLNESVITSSDKFNDFVVPEGYIFAMGDNRAGSIDCRSFGCIPLNKIEGIVLIRFWPFDKFGEVL